MSKRKMNGGDAAARTRNKLEKILQKGETWRRMTFEDSPLLMALVDRRLRIIKVNKAFRRSTGFSEEEAKQRSLKDVVPPKELRRTRGERDRLIKGAIRKFSVEYRYTAANGKDKWIAVTNEAIRDERGKFLCFMTTAENITVRKRAEQALRENSERFRLTFETAPIGMVLCDRDGRFVRANKAFCRILGYSQEETLRRNFSDVTHPDHVVADIANIRKLLQGKIPRYHTQKRYIRKDGDPVWASVTVFVLRDKEGKFLSFLTFVEDITARTFAEEARRDSEERFRLAFEENTVGMAMVDRDHRFVKVNRAYCRMLGYAEKELMRMKLSDVTHPDDFAGQRKLLRDAERGRLPRYQIEKRYVTKKGDIVWGSLTASVIRDRQGTFLCTMGIIEDITERRRAEAALLESEQRYRAFFENSIEGVLLTTPDGQIQAANPEACRIFGMSEAELKRAGREGIIDKSDPEIPRSLKIKERARRYKGVVRFRRKDGTVFSAEIATSLYTDRDGREKSTLILRDITERKRAEAALRESEQRYRSIFENAPFGIFHSTKAGKLIDVNEIYARQLGFSSPRECIDMTNRGGGARGSYVHPDRRRRFLRKVLSLGGWHQFENLYIRRDGQPMPGFLRFRSIPKDPVTGAELEGFVEDLSARKKAEEKVRLYQEKLRDLSMQLAFVEEKERQRLANNIHDYIGQSLSCAMLALGALENEMPATPKAQEALRKVREQIEEGIQYARSVTFELSPAILFKLGFEAVVEWLADRLLTPNKVRFSITGESSLKLPDTEVRVILFRAMRELLMNVVKHAKAGEVWISLRKKKGDLEITVQDNGNGFDVLLLSKRTEGFGLFSVREQLMYIGGRMSIISKPGQGSIVTIIFPLGGNGREERPLTADREGGI